jgi:adenosyl cobinamide kinase/adenosyl cobinamide phosphate guanylyltransferase
LEKTDKETQNKIEAISQRNNNNKWQTGQYFQDLQTVLTALPLVLVDGLSTLKPTSIMCGSDAGKLIEKV